MGNRRVYSEEEELEFERKNIEKRLSKCQELGERMCAFVSVFDLMEGYKVLSKI